MIVVASLEAVVLLAAIYLLMRHHTHSEQAWTEERRELLTQQAQQHQQWSEERRELLNRVQRPDYLPLPSPENFVLPEPEPDEIELVGTIQEKDE